MLFSCFDTLHVRENPFFRTRSPLLRSSLPKVQRCTFSAREISRADGRMHFFRESLPPRRRPPDLQHAKDFEVPMSAADIFSRRNELVQDRDGGSVWPALAFSFLWVNQPCRR